MSAPVSDHAVIRWLERVGGIDMEYFRREIAERCAPVLDAGANGGWVDDHWVVVKNGIVVTFKPTRPVAKMRKLEGARP